MAPSRPSGGRAGPSKPGKNSNKRGGKPVGSKSGSKSSSSGVSKPRSKSTPSKKGAPARKSIEQLTKGIAKQPTKKKRRTYTEKELGIPALNMITPAGVSKPKGKKKGKVFVDDRESMMTILAMVNADKEGQIESKMMKARQLEEIRQARAKEMEARQAMRKDKLEATKDSLRRGRKGKDAAPDSEEAQEKTAKNASQPLKRKKRVSFGRDA